VLSEFGWGFENAGAYYRSGVEHKRFQKLLIELTTEEQRERLGEALAALM
jgi:hypothetical protein